MTTQDARRPITLLALVLLLLPVLLACGGGDATSTPAATATTAAAANGGAPSQPPAANTVAPTSTVQPATMATASPDPNAFSNPVYGNNFPDPFILKAGGVYYAYATNNGIKKYQLLKSKDLVNWAEGPDPLPELPAWATKDTWAPEVLRRKDGKYVLYLTARSSTPRASEDNALCIDAAIGDSPEGPFKDPDGKPLVCQVAEGGSIDASPFQDPDGGLYLQWKNDGNCCGLPTYIYSQKLSPDGMKLTGKPARLVKQDRSWEGPLIEAPTMWKQDGKYYLFFSANAFYNETYAVGYATCKGPLGPCKDAPENPILTTSERAVGPGHQSIIADDDGELWMAYHAWPPDAVGSVSPGRVFWIDKLVFKNGKPDVLGPTEKPQPLP